MILPIISHPEQNNDLLKSKGVSLCAFLDIVRQRNDKTYTVRIRIIFNRYPKLYSTKINLTENQYLQIATGKPKKELNQKKNFIHGLIKKAYDIILSLKTFSFESFDALFYLKKAIKQKDVSYYYNLAIEGYRRNEQIGTALNYEFSLRSLLEFNNNKPLNFTDITPQWLKDYEKYMIEVEDKEKKKKRNSKTTVGIYLRPLRAIFNNAIFDKVISMDFYPFGKRRYAIPAPKGVKKALPEEQLMTLLHGNTQTDEHEKAKAFWFFSFFCNGMNIKDIVHLQYKNLSEDSFTFNRAKTENTNKHQASSIVFLNDFTISVINKYCNPDRSPENYIFPILEPTASPVVKHKQTNNFIRYINQHFLKYAKSLGFTEHISTYWARHSFATLAIRNGASMEFISELLLHETQVTTQVYYAGAENKTKKDFALRLYNSLLK